MKLYGAVNKKRCGQIKRSGRTFSLVGHKDGYCRWCGAVVTGRRKTWCGDECAEEYLLLKSPAAMRKMVEARDRGICAECGFDTIEETENRNRAIRALAAVRIPYEDLEAAVNAILKGIPANHMRDRWTVMNPTTGRMTVKAISSMYQVDHVEELADGGCWGIDNLRTVCLPCHYKKTADSANHRRDRKRHEQLEVDLKKKAKKLTRDGKTTEAKAVLAAVEELFPKAKPSQKKRRKR